MEGVMKNSMAVMVQAMDQVADEEQVVMVAGLLKPLHIHVVIVLENAPLTSVLTWILHLRMTVRPGPLSLMCEQSPSRGMLSHSQEGYLPLPYSQFASQVIW